jgi:putative heme-binding domain-containing protein
MLENSRLAQARLQALSALDGLDALNETTLRKGLSDHDDAVRERAVLLCEKLIANRDISDALWDQLMSLADDPAIRVRYQLAFTLGEIHRPSRVEVFARLIQRELNDRWMETAVLSSLSEGAGEMVMTLASVPGFAASPAGQALLERIATMTGTKGQMADVKQLIAWIVRNPIPKEQQFALLSALGEGLRSTRSSLGLVDPGNHLRPVFQDALSIALDYTFPQSLRLQAIRLTGVSPFSELGGLGLVLFNSGESGTIQAAGLRMLGRLYASETAPHKVEEWPVLPPNLRRNEVTALLSHSQRLAGVLDILEYGRLNISRKDFSSAQINFLRTYSDTEISRRAVRLFGPATPLPAETLARFNQALRIRGDISRGRATFQARCASCHSHVSLSSEERTGSKASADSPGPDLRRAPILGKEKILKALLDPGAEIAPGYSTSVVTTGDGEILIGTIADDNDTAVTLRQPGGIETVLPRVNIQDIRAQPWSLMPDVLELSLLPQEVADVMDYLVNGGLDSADY